MVHVEYSSKDGFFSTVLLHVCKESRRVFRRNYKPSTIVLSPSGTSKIDPAAITSKNAVQHGYIDLERDVLYFDPSIISEFLRGIKSTMTLDGLKAMAISSCLWREVLILHSRLGQAAFPSLRHLEIVLGNIELRVEHVAVADLNRKSSSFSLVSCRPADDSSMMARKLHFELSKVAEEESDLVIKHTGDIQTAVTIETDMGCPWSFFLAQGSYLLARSTHGMLGETIELNENVKKLVEQAKQAVGENNRILAKGRKASLGMMVFQVLYLLFAAFHIYSMYSSRIWRNNSICD